MTAPCLARAIALLTLIAAGAFTSGCSSPSGNELFAKNGISSGAAANLGGSTNASAGTDSGSGPAMTEVGGSEALGGTSAVGGGMSGSGGSGGTGAEPALGGSSGSGGQAMQPPPVIHSCDMLDGAVTNEQNGHCYRVTTENLTFAAARDACQAAGGHLLTVSSEEENDFARDLHDGEHWLGASDGIPDDVAGVGSYSWVNEEDWEYTDWRDGQPNAFETNCPDGGDASDCFEHCAYQADEGDWIDRSCWHAIVSICEWEPVHPTTL
jgi:hypothetical protein